MADMIDNTRPIRAGEELDLDSLRAHLSKHLPAGGEASFAVEQFPGGHSNLTYLVRWGDQEYVLRRPPFGSKVKSAHDMKREHRVLSALSPRYDKAPRPVLFCDDHSVLGADFYLMERVRGVVLRKKLPAGLTISPSLAARLSEVAADTLAELHSLDIEAAGLGDFGKPEGYVERQVSGWSKRYADARTDDIPAVDEVAAWLAANLPPDGEPAILHNDFKFDNLVLDPDDLTRVRGILDWEMSTIGDPLMDLGTALCYWVEAGDPPLMNEIRFGPTNEPGMMTRRELAARYAASSGRDLSNIVFYYAFGLFKTAVVAQQIYYRFAQGLTQDQRFAMMIVGVRALAAQAKLAIDSDTL